jgi:outer membrane protein TolC
MKKRLTYKKDSLLVCLFLLSFGFNFSQESKAIFTFKEYSNLVRSNHPVAIQANLQIEKGQAYILKARGGFDPKLYGTAGQKYFNEDQYFSLINGGIKVPTWFGITVEAGYQTNEGVYLNPENKDPLNGLWNAGITINLGKGLFIDERRAELKKAKIYANSTEAQQRIILNDLLYESTIVYWEWFKSYHKVAIYQDALSNAQTRFYGVRREAILGNKPYIDTLESLILVQDRQIGLQEALLEYKNNTNLLEVYLWQEGIIPLEIDSTVIPPKIDTSLIEAASLSLLNQSDSLIASHPDLTKYAYMIDMERIDLRLNRENLKPTIELKYNALADNTFDNTFETYNINNYKWGAEVSFPIFIRKERGELRLTKLEIRDMEAGFANKSLVVRYKVNTAYNSWNTSYNQALLYDLTRDNYENLLDAELRLFNIGESSIFMINSREKNFIYSQIEFVNSLAENKKAEVKMKYFLGVLAQ